MLNIILDIVFVIPPLSLGVAGTAIATVIAQMVSAVLCCVYSVRNVQQFRDAMKYLKPDSAIVKKVIRIGIPSGFQYALIFISSLALQSVVNGFGQITIGAFTATTQIETLAIQIPNAIATAMLTYVGQNIGANQTERVKTGLHAAFRVCIVASVIMAAVICIFGDSIMSIFVSDEAIISLAADGMRIESLFLIIYCMSRVLQYTLNGAGDAAFSMLNGIVEIVARITFVFVLTSIPFLGVWGIWLTTGCTWIVTTVTALLRYRSGVWKTK